MDNQVENIELNTKIQQGVEHLLSNEDYLPVYHVYNRYAKEKLGMNEREAMDFSEHVIYDLKWLLQDDKDFWTWYYDNYLKNNNPSSKVEASIINDRLTNDGGSSLNQHSESLEAIYDHFDNYENKFEVYKQYFEKSEGYSNKEAIEAAQFVCNDATMKPLKSEIDVEFWMWYKNQFFLSSKDDLQKQQTSGNQVVKIDSSAPATVHQKLPIAPIDINSAVSQAIANNVESNQTAQQKIRTR